MVITAKLNNGRIELRGSYTAELEGFYRSLPTCRWDKKQLCWACAATPAAAARIVESGIQADAEVESIAARFQSRSAAAAAFREAEGPQPEICKTRLWRHQLRAYHFARQLDSTMLSCAMGTGKSLVALTLICNRGDRLVLIVCPTTVMAVWRREFDKHAATPWTILVLDGTQSVKRKAEIAESAVSGRGNRAVVVNYEAIWRPEFKAFATRTKWDCVIADESHRAKGHGSKTSKALADIGKAAKHRLALTGTPMPHSPMDIFGQFRFLDPGIFGTSYHYFRTRFAISGHFGADHIVGFQNQDELAARMRLVTFEVSSDVLELPDAQHHQRTFDLSKKTRTVYDSLKDEMIALIEDGTITAANALVKLLRLQQITSGFVTDDEGAELELGTEKVSMLGDLLEDINEPVVVFCRFRRDLRLIESVAGRLGRTYGEISGARKDLTDHAQMPEGISVMGVQIRSGGVGIDLTRAAYGVYWNLPWSLGDFDQSLARINRPGQTKPVNYYYLIANGTVDETVFAALEKKRDVVEEVLSYLRHGQ